MKLIRVLSVFGTRPEAIKMCPLVLGMLARPKRFKPITCVTGQHREMLGQVMGTFGLEADHDLAVMQPNQTLAGLSARILEGVSAVIERERPDVVLVQGDTTSALAAGLATFYQRVPVGHVEAGLRTGDFANPFPEELNRALLDRFATWCFAPTSDNARTLRREGVPADRVFVTGNTGIDALLLTRGRVKVRGVSEWTSAWGLAADAVADSTRPLVLITAHRRESFGAKIRGMFQAIARLARRHRDWVFVYPVHLNPNVRDAAAELLAGQPNLHLIEPLPYEPFVFLMDRASLILTDSGGIQEEAPSLGKPVVVMRETTERQEAVRAGTVTLAGNTGRGLEAVVERLMAAGTRRPRRNPYGDGHATERILDVLEGWKAKR